MKAYSHALFPALLLMAGMFALSACGNTSEKKPVETEGSTEETNVPAESETKEAGTTSSDLKTWTLTSYGAPENLSRVPEGMTITMQMDVAENRVSGSAGCNNYFGQLSDQDDGYRITGVGSTKKMCADEMVMEMEDKYLKMLNQVTGYAFRDNKMIVDVDGGMQLVFSGS